MAKRPQRLAVDTSVATYLVVPEPPEGQEKQWADARELLNHSGLYEFCLPAPALGELMLIPQPETRDDFAQEVARRFMILPYDFGAARLMANTVATSKTLKQAAERIRQGRQCIKVDWEIACCAARHSACLCTNEPSQARFFDSMDVHLRSGSPADFLVGTVIPLPLRNRPSA